MTSYATALAGPEGDARRECGRRPWRLDRRWHAWEIALMVLGFIVFWPVGLAILFWILWRKRHGGEAAVPAWLSHAPGPLGRHSGNSAFEEWKRAELDRLEEERKKLAQAQADFAAFLDRLERAKDREEFDRFMAERGRASPRAEA
jgi:uncharacterized protein DUF2852